MAGLTGVVVHLSLAVISAINFLSKSSRFHLPSSTPREISSLTSSGNFDKRTGTNSVPYEST